MDCSTADFLRPFNEICQNLASGWTAEYSPSNPKISRIPLKFPNFLRVPNFLSNPNFLKSFGNSYIQKNYSLYSKRSLKMFQ